MHFKLLFVKIFEHIFSLYTLDQITNNGAPVLAFAKHIPIILDNLVNPANLGYFWPHSQHTICH